MRRTHFRKVLGDIFARKGRTLLVSTSIFVGVLGVITLFTVRNLITSQLDSDLQEDEIAMIELFVNVKEGESADLVADLTLLNDDSLPGLEGIERVEGLAYHDVAFKKPSASRFESGQLRAFSSPLQDIKIEPLRLVEGEFPSPGQGEVALEKRMADANGFKVGDTIIIRTREGETTRETDFKVSGIVFHPYSYRAPSNFGGFSPGPEVGIYAQYEDAQALLSIQGFTSLVARYESFAQAEAQFEAFQQVVTTQTAYEPFLPLLDNPAENRQIRYAENFNNVLTMLSFVAMLVSGFLVINVINAIVFEQKRQIGVMKAMGALPEEVLGIYVGIALLYGLIGTIAALVPSIILGNAAAHSLAPQLDVLLEGFNWSPSAVILGVVMGIVVPALSAIIPVWLGTRVTVLEAMTDLGISGEYGHGPLARLIKLIPLPMVLRQALNNVNRKKNRLALTGLTLTSAVAAFMGVSAVGISLTTITADIFGRLGYEILIIPNEIRSQEAKTAIESLESVEIAHTGTVVAVKLSDDYVNFFTQDNQIVIFGVDPATDVFEFKLSEGEGWNKDTTRPGAVVSEPIAKLLNLGVGDELSFTVQGQTITQEIIGIDSLGFDGIWLNWEVLSHLVGLETPQIGGLGGQALSNSFYVDLENDSASVEEVNAVIDEISAALLSKGITIQIVRNQVEQNVETTRIIDQNIGILNLAATLIALVGAIGLLTTLTMAVFERQKEIGVMRSMGADSLAVTLQFLVEGLLVGVVAWVIAIPISIILAQAINTALGFETLKFTYPPRVLVIGFISMMVLASIASIGPSLSAARKTVSSILRYQ